MQISNRTTLDFINFFGHEFLTLLIIFHSLLVALHRIIKLQLIEPIIVAFLLH